MQISTQHYGTLKNGRDIQIFTLVNDQNIKAQITNYGGIIVSLEAPDKEGHFSDIVLGKASLADYEAGHPCFGALTGRVAGRIGKAQFEINGQSYQLEANNGPNCLHGGLDGWHLQVWEAKIIKEEGIEKLHLSYTDPDGHNNFPGTVSAEVTYALLENNALEITYRAHTDQATPFNPTNHCYFNLAGESTGASTLADHIVQIEAHATAKTSEDMTLIGEKSDLVEGLNDLRKPIRIGDLSELSPRNVDSHYFLNGGRTQSPRHVATVSHPQSQRVFKLWTTEPGVQFYTAINLSTEGPDIGKNNQAYETNGAFCLETQDYPDSIHYPSMGSAILKPESDFYSRTLFQIETLND